MGLVQVGLNEPERGSICEGAIRQNVDPFDVQITCWPVITSDQRMLFYMVSIDVWCGSNPPVKRNGTRKPLSDNRESVHDPGIDRAIDGVAPENVLPAGTGEIAESNDFPVERLKTETQILDNHISTRPPSPRLTGVLVSPNQLRKAVSEKISGPDKVPIQACGPEGFAGEIERADAEPHSDLACDNISPQDIRKSVMIDIRHAGNRPLRTRRRKLMGNKTVTPHRPDRKASVDSILVLRTLPSSSIRRNDARK